MSSILANVHTQYWSFTICILFSLFSDGLLLGEFPTDFYKGCGTPSKICSGLGPDLNCIKSRSCIIAGTVAKIKNVENTTDFVVQLMSEFVAKTMPCQMFGYVITGSHFITSVNYTVLQLQNCKENFKLEDFKFMLYVNTSACNFNPVKEDPSGVKSTSATFYLKSTNKTSCDQRFKSPHSRPAKDKKDFDFDIRPFTGLSVLGNGCNFFKETCRNSTDCIQWPEVYHDMKQYQGNFYTNINSLEQLTCRTKTESESSLANYVHTGESGQFICYTSLIMVLITCYIHN